MSTFDVTAYVRNFVQQNGNLTPDQLRVELREAMRKETDNGAKISKKDFARASATLNSELAAKAECAKTNITVVPKVKETVKTVNAQEAVKTYASNAVNRDSRRASLFDGMIDKEHQGAANFEKHLETLSPEARQTALEESKQIKIEPYISAKKAKEAKKSAELASSVEHKRYRDSKKLRDARYCTENGIMNKDAKKVYNAVAQKLKQGTNITAESIDAGLEIGRNAKSAEESAKIFMENGFEPIKEAANKLKGKGGKMAIVAAAVALVGATIATLTGKKQGDPMVDIQQMAQNLQSIA